MIVIAGPRKSSRTTRLIELSAEAEANHEVNYIVVGTQEQAYRVHQKAMQMGRSIGFPLTFDEFIRQDYFGRNIDHLLIDNADHLLQRLAIVPIKAIVVEQTPLIDEEAGF